jgi:hypothetical protein
MMTCINDQTEQVDKNKSPFSSFDEVGRRRRQDGDSDENETSLVKFSSSDDDDDNKNNKDQQPWGVMDGIVGRTTTTMKKKGRVQERQPTQRKVSHKADRILSVHEINTLQRQLSSRYAGETAAVLA